MNWLKPLILYFTADFPSNGILKNFLSAVDPEVVKYVEIGIPERDPLYDGPTIKSTHSVALKNFSPEHLGEFADMIGDKGIRSFGLSYYGQIRSGGVDFVKSLRESGFSGIIVPDLLTDYPEDVDRIIPRIEESFQCGQLFQ